MESSITPGSGAWNDSFQAAFQSNRLRMRSRVADGRRTAKWYWTALRCDSGGVISSPENGQGATDWVRDRRARPTLRRSVTVANFGNSGRGTQAGSGLHTPKRSRGDAGGRALADRTDVRYGGRHGLGQSTDHVERDRTHAERSPAPQGLVPRTSRRWRRQPGMVAQTSGVRATARAIAPAPGGRCRADRPLCRAALPFQLQLPRWGVACRRVGRRSRPPRPRRIGAHRSQRLLRCRALRRGRTGAWPAHGLRCRAHLGAHGQTSSRATRPSGRASDRARAQYPPDIRGSVVPSATRRWPAKGAPRIALPELTDIGAGGDAWAVLTSCRKGTVPAALDRDGPRAARRALDDLVARFGRTNVVVELWDHGHPLDSARNDALAEIAIHAGVEVIATNNVHYHRPARRKLATAMAAVRARRSLDEIDGWLPAASTAHLRSGAEQAARFARYPGVVEPRRGARSGLRVRSRIGGAQAAAVPVPARSRRDVVVARSHRTGSTAAIRSSRW